ncbi:uncharacterized protein isoform X2 [Musca autumnalis]|uniref:uncharacterized protein isoform X2 n=1 Tax=Musca autumnalis TaxID=221902 RepID=UPI003CE86211
MNAKQSARLKTKRKPGDPWISKNRVLNPTKSKRNCPIYRNPNFDTDETKLLIQLWGDPKVQRELITTHKKHLVIAQLASKMEEYGYYRSPEEITTRIKNMKCFYNRLKKEMELNKNMDISWRHYADMDAIMTRPIFSVRPNEVPAPSLKYLREQEEEQRKERKRNSEEEGFHVSESDDDIEDVLAGPATGTNSKTKENNTIVEPHAEIELEVDEETLAAIEKGGSRLNSMSPKANNNKSSNVSEDEMMIKMEIESEDYLTINEQDIIPAKSQDNQKTQTSGEELLVPKIEPIDVDDETPSDNSTNTSSPTVRILNKSVNKITAPQSSSTTSTSTTTSSVTQSKISVVSPTILMPSTGQTAAGPATTTIMNTQSPRPMQISGNLQALLASSSSARQTVTAANGMKFILVNGRGAQIATALPTLAQKSPVQPQNATSIQQTQKSQLPATSPQNNIQNNATRKRPLDSSSPDRDTLRKRELAGIKSTLQKLLKAKEESNEMAAQRLALERERLQFERTIAEKFLGIFEQNQKIQQQLLQQQIQLSQSQQRPTTTQQIFTTTTANPAAAATALQNQGQRVMQPKLLITTMVPTSVATSTGTGGVNTSLASKILTTANVKSVANNISLEQQQQPLLTPKEEPAD